LLFSSISYAQTENKFDIGVGGSFAKPKIIPKLEKLGIAQITVNYKLTSTVKTIGGEKSTGAMAGAKISAYLQTSDGDLTENDFQEVTNHFYSYFQKQLKSNGIDTIGWNAISATDFYKNIDDEKDKSKQEASENVWVTHTAHNGKVLYGGNIAFAFGKIKKATKFCEQIAAPAGFFNLTVDFADVMVNVDINTAGSGLYFPKTRTTKFKSAVKADMKVIPSHPGDFSLFWNEKTQSETLILKKDIEAGIAYHENISEDVSKARTGLAKQFSFRKEMTPVLIETTREKYKAAAKKALEKYADAFIAKAKEVKKD
jgi:hypothetical protein